MKSWVTEDSLAPKRTLGIYIDISRCQSLSEGTEESYVTFEMSFISELCSAIKEELQRSWPKTEASGILGRLFKSAEAKQRQEVDRAVEELSEVLASGVPTLVDRSGEVKIKTTLKSKETSTSKVGLDAKSAIVDASVGASASAGGEQVDEIQSEKEWSSKTHYRLNVADLLRVVGALREAARISSIYIFVDEFSALSTALQGRFTTLLKKILGNQNGVFLKLSAITDNYTLGSSIILQRDLFEIALDLDSFVERSDSLNAAVSGLAAFAKKVIETRLETYTGSTQYQLFEDTEVAYRELSRAAMGVPRTLGLALTHAWNRARSSGRSRLSRADVEYGVKSASRGYLNQLVGASKGGVAIPAYAREIWDALITRAVAERSAGRGGDASHFMILPRHQDKLKLLNMFFVVHLLTDGRTTKKDKSSRSLYCFDYGQCLENNLGFSSDKNVLRQQRFAYDDILEKFDAYFTTAKTKSFICPVCNTKYTEDELMVAGTQLSWCPKDRTDLIAQQSATESERYTEEEIKIIGAVRSTAESQAKLARDIADDVGCYPQKVGKFGARIASDGLILRRKNANGKLFVYYTPVE